MLDFFYWFWEGNGGFGFVGFFVSAFVFLFSGHFFVCFHLFVCFVYPPHPHSILPLLNCCSLEVSVKVLSNLNGNRNSGVPGDLSILCASQWNIQCNRDDEP